MASAHLDRVAVHQNGIEQLFQMSRASGAPDLRCRCCDTAPGADEVMEVHLLIRAVAGLLVGGTGTGLVKVQLSLARAGLTSNVAIVSISLRSSRSSSPGRGGDVANLIHASHVEPEERWGGLLFRHKPFNLLRFDIGRVRRDEPLF